MTRVKSFFLSLPPIRSHVHFVEIVITECSVTFGTFPLSCIVPRLQAINTKDVETFGEDSIFRTCVTNRTHQFRLK